MADAMEEALLQVAIGELLKSYRRVTVDVRIMLKSDEQLWNETVRWLPVEMGSFARYVAKNARAQAEMLDKINRLERQLNGLLHKERSDRESEQSHPGDAGDKRGDSLGF